MPQMGQLPGSERIIWGVHGTGPQLIFDHHIMCMGIRFPFRGIATKEKITQ
jgi:hypothetical protein